MEDQPIRTTKTITDIQTILTGKTAEQLEATLEEYRGHYIIRACDLCAYGLYVDGNGVMQKKGALLTAENIPTDNADAVLSATGIWEVVGIIASSITAVAAATRTPRVWADDVPPIAVASAARTIETSTVNQVASKHVQFTLGSHPYHWTNVHGTIAIVADENPLPHVFAEGSTIGYENSAANSDAADRLGIRVRYRLLS